MMTYYDAAGNPVPEEAATFRCREVSVDDSAPAPPVHRSLPTRRSPTKAPLRSRRRPAVRLRRQTGDLANKTSSWIVSKREAREQRPG